MRLYKLYLFSCAFLALVIACRALQDASREAVDVHCDAAKKYSDAENWPMAIERYTLAAETCAWEATFLQENDAVNAIEAYKHAARVYAQTAKIARKANLLTQAIEACKRQVQLYKQAAHLCREASNIENEALLHTLVAIAYARMAEICAKLVDNHKSENDCIREASACLMAANAFRESADSFSSASDMDDAIAMFKLAAEGFTTAASIFHDAECCDQEANAWMQAAEASALSAWVYRQIEDTFSGAGMYAAAANYYMAAARAYRNADNDDDAIDAYQQAVTWHTVAAQMYHDARHHESESNEYIEIAIHYLTQNEQAQAGKVMELAAQACQHAQDYAAAVTVFQEAARAYTAANDAAAVHRVQSAIVACDLTTRNLYHKAVERLVLKRTALSHQIMLYVRRSDLLLDSYNAVMALKPTEALHAECKIVFLEEEADDLGGPSREWFSLLADEMISPPHAFFISRNPADQTYQPNPSKNSLDDLDCYHVFGRVLAMAINSGNFIHFRLTDAFLKHMLGQPVVFEDLRTFDPILYHSYDALKRMPDLSSMDTFFSIDTGNGVVELCPDGNNRPVTLGNRDEYMSLVTNYYLTAQIQDQLKALLSGFNDFVHRDCIASLNTRALTWLINGELTLSVDDWEQNTLYEGYSATSMPVIWFWSTVRSFSPEQQAKLLHFVTGSSLVPLGGFSSLCPKFTITEIKQDEDHAPSAATCFRKLYLPNYSSETILRDKLLYAIEEGHVSFGFV